MFLLLTFWITNRLSPLHQNIAEPAAGGPVVLETNSAPVPPLILTNPPAQLPLKKP